MLLLAGYEGMKQRKAKIPNEGKLRLTEALDRLVQLYDALGKKDESAKWRKELVIEVCQELMGKAQGRIIDEWQEVIRAAWKQEAPLPPRLPGTI